MTERQFYARLARRLRESRQRRGLRQLDLALELGVSTAAVSKWEQDYTRMPAWAYVRLNHVLGGELA